MEVGEKMRKGGKQDGVSRRVFLQGLAAAGATTTFGDVGDESGPAEIGCGAAGPFGYEGGHAHA